MHANSKSLDFLFVFQQDEIRCSVYQKRRHLKEAFDLICEELNECMVLKFDTWKSLLELLCPKYSPGKVSLLWNVLDRENNDYTSKHLFSYIFL